MASIYGGQTFGFFLEDINPVTWGALGVGVAMGLSGVGAAWYVVFIYLIIFRTKYYLCVNTFYLIDNVKNALLYDHTKHTLSR